MAHMTKNLGNNVYDALVADSDVVAVVKIAGNIHKGLNIITNDYTKMPKPFINVMGAGVVRNAVMSHKGRYDAPIIVEFVEDEVVQSDFDSYQDNLEKIHDVLTTDALYNPTFSGDKAWMEEDGYEELPPEIIDSGIRITTITMDYKYDKVRP